MLKLAEVELAPEPDAAASAPVNPKADATGPASDRNGNNSQSAIFLLLIIINRFISHFGRIGKSHCNKHPY